MLRLWRSLWNTESGTDRESQGFARSGLQTISGQVGRGPTYNSNTDGFRGMLRLQVDNALARSGSDSRRWHLRWVAPFSWRMGGRDRRRFPARRLPLPSLQTGRVLRPGRKFAEPLAAGLSRHEMAHRRRWRVRLGHHGPEPSRRSRLRDTRVSRLVRYPSARDRRVSARERRPGSIAVRFRGGARTPDGRALCP